MSQSYEMLYILRPSLSEEQVQQEVRKYQEFLSEYSVTDLQTKVWGKRRLAYPIQRYFDGIYVQMNYHADGTQVAPLERSMRLSEEVIRYLTIKLKKTASEEPESEPVVEAKVEPKVEPKVEAKVESEPEPEPVVVEPESETKTEEIVKVEE